MSESSLSITYEDLRKEVGYALGFSLSASSVWDDEEEQLVDMCIEDGLRMFYNPPSIDGTAHQWRFMRPIGELETTAPYSTGTIQVASGVVTLTGGTFPSWAAGGDLVVNSKSYAIDTRDSDTQVTLEDTTVTVASGTSYELRRYAYDLPDDFGGIDSPMTFQPSKSVTFRPVKQVSESLIRKKRQYEFASSQPELFATHVKVMDPTVGTRYEVWIYPTSDKAYQLEYQYKSYPNKLSTTNKYPLGGMAHAETIKAACLAAVELKNDDMQGPRYQYFMERIQASIMIDRQENSAKHLGYNRDRSEDSYDPQHHRSNYIVPYNDYYPGS